MSNIKFYRVTLELKAKLNKSGISFLGKLPDVIAAKNSFNTAMQGSKYIAILSLTQTAVNLLLRLDNPPDRGSVGLRTIGRLVTILLDDLDWRSFFGSKARVAFRVSSVNPLSADECRTVVNAVYIESNGYLDSTDISRLFENLGEAPVNEVPRASEPENREDTPLTGTLEEALKKIDELKGISSFKEEIRKITGFAGISSLLTCKGSTSPVFPYHYLFRGDAGVDHVMPARLMLEVLFHLGLIKKRRFVRLNVPEESNEYSGLNFEGNVDEEDTGAVLVENIFDSEDPNTNEIKILSKISEKMQQLKGKTVIILSCYNRDDKGYTSRLLDNALKKGVNCRQVSMDFYSDSELDGTIKGSAEARGCKITGEAVDVLRNGIKSSGGLKGFDAVSMADSAVERAFADKLFSVSDHGGMNVDDLALLSAEDFRFITGSPEDETPGISPRDELREMVGLECVKLRVEQILNVLTANSRKKVLGITAKPVCLHMQFTGNPGTGKTTVARILGRLMREMGVLSSGHFLELTRNDLIGEYIGQTTPKVKRALKKAMGGIMFIDEAYSLYQNAENDYGNEAVSELLKGMEDYKDDMMVIFAGYPREMERMMEMNPGLKDRVAFTIEFPDYSVEELYSIFCKMYREGGYSVTPEASDKILGLIKSLCAVKVENFSNARIIRKIYERLEILQNCRVCSEGIMDRDGLTVINGSDFERLMEDSEIKKLVRSGSRKGAIGF